MHYRTMSFQSEAPNSSSLQFRLLLALALLVCVTLCGCSSVGVENTSPIDDLRATDLDETFQDLGALEKRHKIAGLDTSQQGLTALVGQILVVDKNQVKGADRTQTIRHLRPDADRILVAAVDRTLYEGKATTDRIVRSGYGSSLDLNLTAGEAVDILVKDDLWVGYKDTSEIPYESLRQLTPPLGKTYYFVESITVTSAVYRTFSRIDAEAGFQLVFRAGGEYYGSQSGYAYSRIASIDAWDIALLAPGGGEASGAPGTIDAILNSELNGLREDDATELLEYLRNESRERAARDLEGIVLDPVDNGYRIPGEVKGIKQERPNGCWAAASTMLLNWQMQERDTIEERLAALGGDFLHRHELNLPLDDSAKADFLGAAGLAFMWGQSFSAKGLRSTLEEYGPLWMTVDGPGFSTHATVVIGVSGVEDHEETVVSFVDPRDGAEHTMPYSQFARKMFETASSKARIQIVYLNRRDSQLASAVSPSEFVRQASVDDAGERARIKFESFHRAHLNSRVSIASRDERLEAAKNLATWWIAKGIYCVVVTSERNPDRIYVRILPSRSWREAPNMFGSSWQKALSNGSPPVKPHALCYLAEDLFWNSEVSGELLYYLHPMLAEEQLDDIGDYSWSGNYEKHLQAILLPLDFPYWVDDFERHSALRFARVQHRLHNARVTRQASPHHARVQDVEIGRLVAFREVIDELKAELVEAASLGREDLVDELLSKLSYYSVEGLDEATKAREVLGRLSAALASRSVFPRFDSDWDDVVLAHVESGGEKATLFLVELDSAEDSDRDMVLGAFVAGCLDAIATDQGVLDHEASRFGMVNSGEMTMRELISRMDKEVSLARSIGRDETE